LSTPDTIAKIEQVKDGARMKKRVKKKKAYKKYIQDIFTGYEQMLENPEIKEKTFHHLKEETILKRDENNQIRFRTRDID
jgi:hypothetical protein